MSVSRGEASVGQNPLLGVLCPKHSGRPSVHVWRAHARTDGSYKAIRAIDLAPQQHQCVVGQAETARILSFCGILRQRQRLLRLKQGERMKAQNRSRHGLYAAMVKVKLAGFNAIDRRTAGGRSLLAWKRQVIADCGGQANIPATKMALIDSAAATRALIAHIDVWLLGQRSVVNAKRKSVIPVLLQRQSLCDSLARTLAQIGLERTEKSVREGSYSIEFVNGRPTPVATNGEAANNG